MYIKTRTHSADTKEEHCRSTGRLRFIILNEVTQKIMHSQKFNLIFRRRIVVENLLSSEKDDLQHQIY